MKYIWLFDSSDLIVPTLISSSETILLIWNSTNFSDCFFNLVWYFLFSVKNLSAVWKMTCLSTPHKSSNWWMTFESSSNSSNERLLATKYRRTIPSEILLLLISLIYPTSLVLSLWVPQQASISTSFILTTLNWFPGTTPPWYRVNPYFFSASALFIQDFVIWWPSKTILFAIFWIALSSSYVKLL